jgi:HK97 gp10 family phage protein
VAGQRMETRIDVNDTAFVASLTRAWAELRIASEEVLMQKAIEVTNRAKQFAPVATGRLRASIAFSEVMHDAKGAYCIVGSDVVYAPFVEWGTFRARAQPFFRPALAEASRGAFKMLTLSQMSAA